MKAASVSPERATVVSHAASVLIARFSWHAIFFINIPVVALAVLAAAHGDAGLIHAARQAFTASMSATFTVSAIGVLAAALLATLVMRTTKPEPAAVPADEHELVARPRREGRRPSRAPVFSLRKRARACPSLTN